MLSFGDIFSKQPDIGVDQNENSMHKFVENFSRGAAQVGLPIVDLTVARSVGLKPNEQKVSMDSLGRRASLTLNNSSRKRLNDSATTVPNPAIKQLKENSSRNGQFNFLPVPEVKKVVNMVAASTSKLKFDEEKPKPRNDVIENVKKQALDPYRSLSLITGNVEFAIRINKIHRSSDLMYEIYAKLIRISIGKYPCEHVILLRNDTGPVLQAVYYEIDRKIPKIEIGKDVRCVGKFKGSSRIHLFKLVELNHPPNEESLIRLQNLCNFTMNKVNNNKQ